MSRLDALWTADIRSSISDVQEMIKKAYDDPRSRKRTIALIGESGTAKSWTWEHVAKDLGIKFWKLVGSGLAMEDVRGMPALIKKIPKELHYEDDNPNVMIAAILEDYIKADTVYSFQLLEVLSEVFQPGAKGILLIDEWAQAVKEVQDVFFQIVYDRRVDNYILPEGVMVGTAMNPPSVSEYMLNAINKAAQDRLLMVPVRPKCEEWIEWAETDTEADINQTLVDCVREHTEIYTRNMGRRLHALSDSLVPYGKVDPKDDTQMRLVKHLVYGSLDIESADIFCRYLKEIYEISGINVVKGDKTTFKRLKKMIGSDGKAVQLHRVHGEMLRALESPKTLLKGFWNEKKEDESWKRASKNIITYLKHLTDKDMDSAISLLKSILNLQKAGLDKYMNEEFTQPDNADFAKELLRCMDFSDTGMNTEAQTS
jgi:MoxR-like ATPase/DNA-binding ferritin-like protein (Dps family)